jgi:hypothetical protein
MWQGKLHTLKHFSQNLNHLGEGLKRNENNIKMDNKNRTGECGLGPVGSRYETNGGIFWTLYNSATTNGGEFTDQLNDKQLP